LNPEDFIMHIGLSTTPIEPTYTHGRLDGIGIYTKYLKDGLIERGHDVDCVSYPTRCLSSGNLSEGRPFNVSYATGVAMSMLTSGLMRFNCQTQLFHATDYKILPMKCPVVATLYDAIPLKHPDMANSKLRVIKNHILKSAAKYADHIIAISQYSVEELVEYYKIDISKISVIHCGVDKNWLEPVAGLSVEQTLKKYKLQQGYLLFVGTLQPRKNIDRILDAYSKLPVSVRSAHRLVIVGRQGWGCSETVNRLNNLQAQGDVVWLNHVSTQEELRHLYTGAGMFVFPSLYEGFGLPVVEAFACGVPVVTSNTTSLPEASGGAAIEVNPESVDEITAAMEMLIHDQQVREECIMKGRVQARRKTWDVTIDETIRLYRKIL
jgi:alpha-1,3-rhamnosyl/mannosyltransferase